MYYLHSVPGRLRIRIPHLKNSTSRCQEVQALLLGLVGVEDVSAKCLTGSIVIRYDSEIITSDEILRALKEEKHFEPSRAADTDEYIQKMAVSAGESVGKAVFGWALGKALERSALGLLAAII